jgi:hypothetical protein
MNEPEAKWNVAEWHRFRRLHVAVTKQVEAAPDIVQRGGELSQADTTKTNSTAPRLTPRAAASRVARYASRSQSCSRSSRTLSGLNQAPNTIHKKRILDPTRSG